MSEKDYLAMARVAPEDREDSGVKGMKWGVRKDRGHEGQRAKTKQIAKLDKKFEKTIETANTKHRITPEFHNAVVSRLNDRTRALNDSDKYRNVNMNTASPKTKSDYQKDSVEVIHRSFEDAVREIYGSNASGTKKAVYNRDTDAIDLVSMDAKHADADELVPDVTVLLTRDNLGHVVSFEIEPLNPDMEHSGVKGMKWGIRKADKTSSNTKAPSSGTETSSQKYDRLLAVSKKNGANHLSDEELRFVTQRGDAIRKVNQLTESKPGWLADAAKTALKNAAKREMQQVTANLTKKYISDELFPQSGK